MRGKPACYAISEAVFYLAGGHDSDLHVWRVPMDTAPGHWFLRGSYGEIFDLSAGQFNEHGIFPDYGRAKRAAFYPQVSRLAKELMA